LEKKTRYLIVIVVILLAAVVTVSALILIELTTTANNATNQAGFNSSNNTTVIRESSSNVQAGQSLEECPMCEGTGLVGQWIDCSSCGGTGMIGNQTCSKCEYGRVFKHNSKKCEVCGGKGYVKKGSIKQI
jgi:DnaJ-class molecular chaperone